MKKNIDKINFDTNQRQIELFEKYYNVNKENKTVGFTLHYEKASDLLDTNFGNIKKPQFSEDALKNINSLIEKAPFGYKVEINFEINDYEGYDPKSIIESFNDTLELNQYSARKIKQRKELIASNLILIGIILLFIMVVGKAHNWFGEGIRTEIASEVINIAAWVFVWEAVTMLFLDFSEQKIFALKIKTKVSQISMMKKGDLEPLAVEESTQIFGKWENEGRIRRIGKVFLLISSFAFLFLAFYSIYQLYLSIIDPEFVISKLPLYILTTIISSLLFIFAGIGGISLYNGKNRRASNFVGPYSIFIFVAIIALLILASIFNSRKLIFSSISTVIINILYIIGYIIEKQAHKKN